MLKWKKIKKWLTVLLPILLLIVLITIVFLNKGGTQSAECYLPEQLELKANRIEVQVTSEDIEEERKHELYLYADEENVDSRGAQEGDIIYLRYTVYADKELVGDSGQYIESFELGGEDFPDKLQRHLYGMVPGDTFKFEEMFPEDYYDWILAGKYVEFEGQIDKITELVMPEVTNEFVRENLDYNSVSEYNEYLYKKIYDLKYGMALEDEKESLIREAIAETAFDEPFLTESAGKRYNEVIESYKKYAELFGYTEDDVYRLFDTSPEKLYEIALYTQKKVIFCNAMIVDKRLMPSQERYNNMCLEYAKEYGYDSIEDFSRDNGEVYLNECVNEIIVKDYIYSLAKKE